MKPSDFQSIVIAHCSRYPELQVEDLYKLTHQAALGSEHAVDDINTARQWLVRELDQLPESSVEPLFEEISPDKSIVRVHLKPYFEAGGDLEDLLQAFVTTASEYQGSLELLSKYWSSIEGLAQRGELKFHLDILRSFIDRMEASHFPAVHHSPQYEQAYHPHYRVIASQFLADGTGDLESSP